jgi:hypothetical protein
VIRFLWDENASYDALRALRRSDTGVDVVSVQEAGLAGASDEQVIEFALAEARVVVTGDRRTLVAEVLRRIDQGVAAPGVVVVDSHRLTAGRVATDIVLIAETAVPSDLLRPVYLPL